MIDPDLIDSMCAAPDGQIDKVIKDRLARLKDDPNYLNRLRDIIGDSINGSLVSGFSLTALKAIYVNHGGNIADVTPRIVLEEIER